MKTLTAAGMLAIMVPIGLYAGCSAWERMTPAQKTTAGAAEGALKGGIIAGPPGAVAGGVGGGIVAHEMAERDAAHLSHDEELVRSAQKALNDKGYDAGPADGHLGAKTADAVRKFQSAQGLEQTGQLDPPTTVALGIVRKDHD